jgi:hypothetical protein
MAVGLDVFALEWHNSAMRSPRRVNDERIVLDET